MRWPVAIPVTLLALGAILVPLAAVVELPGEARLQEFLGQEYEEPCGPIVNRGDSGVWRQETAAPLERDGPSGVRVGHHVYLVGGIHSFDDEYRNVDSVHEVERLDLRTGEWEDLPPLPRGLNHVQIAAVDGDLYVLGGLTDRLWRFEATGQSWRFDGDRWEPIAPLPTPRGAGAAVAIGKKIYVVGGVADDRRYTALEVYDVPTGTWEQLSPMRYSRDHLGAAELDGRLYVLGGRRGDDLPLTDFERYDPGSDEWETLPELPEGTAGFGFEEANGRLVATGGENLRERILTGRTWAYDPAEEDWTRLPDMSTPMHGHAMVEYRDRVIVFAGSRCSGYHPFRHSESLEVPSA
jgi:N-acetylneuraminic acid mutarotase